jgi:exosortase E/protease (VPEID-CTERM system)
LQVSQTARFELLRRLAVIGLLFSVELAVITVCLNGDHLPLTGRLVALCYTWGTFILRGIVAFSTLFLAFACFRSASHLQLLSDRIRAVPVNRGLAAGHLAALALFALISAILYNDVLHTGILHPGEPGTLPDLVAFLWLITGLAAILLAATAIISAALWREIARGTGYLWVVSLAAAVIAAFGVNPMRDLWPQATFLTFSIVRVLLRPFGPYVADAATMTITNGSFSENIAPACSGLEGIALILCFTSAWLILFRKELRFPQALFLLPAGVVILFVLNSVRIAALMMIGSAGFVDIAVGGFHSQAGWIAFNFVALGTCLAAREVSWISKRNPKPAATVHTTNPTAAWVMPFVAIMAAGMAARAMTGSFEWLYGLRIVAVAITLWIYRATYKSIDWRFDWTAPAAGLLIFALWLALDRSGPGPMPPELAAASSTARISWILLRVIGATVTVPIAEELAFRGFLLRRFISPEFEAVSFRAFSWFALLASSVLFGLLHGQRWLAGTIAGLVFALVVTRRGRLGNAIIAHATANALIAAAVLMFHRWNLW